MSQEGELKIIKQLTRIANELALANDLERIEVESKLDYGLQDEFDKYRKKQERMK